VEGLPATGVAISPAGVLSASSVVFCEEPVSVTRLVYAGPRVIFNANIPGSMIVAPSASFPWTSSSVGIKGCLAAS
jgi:hypothetical protein